MKIKFPDALRVRTVHNGEQNVWELSLDELEMDTREQIMRHRDFNTTKFLSGS